MGIIQDRLSVDPYPAEYEVPDDRPRLTTTDWERGPIGLYDASGGTQYQNWKVEFAAGQFTIIPETVGSPTVVLTGNEPITSTQCTFCFDQNANANFAWLDDNQNGYLYWYDTLTTQFETFLFETPIVSVGLALDDKREMQSPANDILLWYTVANGGTFDLYHRKQRDRFLTPYLMKSDVFPYIKKSGMHNGLRVQITLSTVND